MNKIIDTNVLLDYPNFFTRQKNLETVIIPYGVIHELEKLKNSQNKEVCTAARRATVQIEKYKNKISFGDFSFYEETNTVDNEIIEIAKDDIKNSIIVTNDLCLSLKANLFGIQTGKFTFNEIHSGIVEFNDTMENCDTLYNDLINGKIPNDLEIYNNEFLVLCVNDTEHSVFKIKNNKPQIINTNNYKNIIKNSFCNTVKPKSLEQLFYFDLLSDDDITIISVSGGFGKGKSFVSLNYALQEYEKKGKKIIYIPNNAYTENAMELGFLPGDVVSKLIGQAGPLVDIVGIDHINKLIAEEFLEIVPISSVRGRSFNNSIILINEAQNITEEHMKLLLGRCGEGSKIIFDGDIKQADSQLFRNRSGLKLLNQLSKSPEYSKIFGKIQLKQGERSFTATAAEYLDEI